MLGSPAFVCSTTFIQHVTRAFTVVHTHSQLSRPPASTHKHTADLSFRLHIMDAIDERIGVIMWWRMQRQRRQAHLQRVRAVMCAAQMHQLIMSPILFMNEPRAYPTRVPRVDLSSWTEADCILRFRFTLPEIERICAAMNLPQHIVVNRVRVTRAFGMAMLMRKLAWPARLTDIAPEFGLDTSSTGRIINEMATMLMTLYRDHLDLWPGLDPDRIHQCAAAISDFSPAVIDIWGFVDGTARLIARPRVNQRPNYSGYKRNHAHNFQGVVTPDGLIVSCMGPFVGSKNDLNMLDETELERTLEPLVKQPGRTLLLYGDLIYKGHPLVMSGFQAASNVGEIEYNKFMSGLRVYIETAFGQVTKLWSGNDLKRVQKTGLSPTAAYYLSAVLLTNVHTCMHPEDVNVPWLLQPPTVEEYLS